jgi:predicted ribonuclease YlaK
MQYSKEIFDKFDVVYITGYVLRELEKHKQSNNEEKKYLSRRAVNDIEVNENKVIYFVSECNYNLPSHLDKDIMDNRIISNFKEIYDKDNSVIFLSNDILFKHNCNSLGVPCQKFGGQYDNDLKNIYKGYRKIVLSDVELASFYERQENIWNILENEYLIIQDENNKTIDIRKWTNNKFVELKTPNIKGIKPKNDLQLCSFDLMNSNNVPIRILLGRPGSGKTYVNLKSALNFLEKGKFARIIYVRNPVGKGEKIGYLPGSKQEKLDPYSQGIIDNLDMGEIQFKQLISQERLQCESPNFMKGASKESSWFLVDEAEDLDIDTLKLIGTRVAKDSNICFSGDLYQTEKQYKYNNGLIEFINKYKGHPLVGIIKLEEDVRSEVSKLFGDL